MIWRCLDRRLRKYPRWRKWRGLPEPIGPRFDEITREALRTLHECVGSWATLNEEYDEPWKQRG